jgi:hypothetical protein
MRGQVHAIRQVPGTRHLPRRCTCGDRTSGVPAVGHPATESFARPEQLAGTTGADRLAPQSSPNPPNRPEEIKQPISSAPDVQQHYWTRSGPFDRTRLPLRILLSF